MGGIIMVFRKCKCGMSVGCLGGTDIKDGDLIKHQDCKLKNDVSKQEGVKDGR
jgi:hypothetical protein